MSQMASEADGTPDASALGTGEVEATDAPDPSAETLIPDSQEGAEEDDGTGQVPETIPYPRFKEVNDAYRPYKELEGLGYSQDSVRSLVEWDIGFSQDPAGNWMAVASQIEGLPDDVVEAIQEHLGDDGEQQPPSTDEVDDSDEDEPPPWAQELLEEKRQREAAQVAQAQDNLLNQVLTLWNQADERAKISIPDKHKLAFIQAQAAHATSIEDLVTKARGDALEFWQHAAGGSAPQPPAQRGSGGSPPRRVPSGGAPPANTPEPLRSLADATRLVKEKIQKGESL